MILDEENKKTKEQQDTEESQAREQAQHEANNPPTYSPSSSTSAAGPSTSPSSSSYPSDLKPPTSPTPPLPLLLPPLYAPSPSSPFLVASSPSYDELIPRLSFISLVKALNSSLAPSPTVKGARTFENVVKYIPGVGVGYSVIKGVVGGLLLGIAKGGAVMAEGGTDGKISRKLAKTQSTMFGSASALLPNATHEIINKANSTSGLFPPSSGLLLALIPYHTLSIVLSQYQALPDIPTPVAAELVKANIFASSSSNLAPDQRKALRVRSRIDFRRWSWVIVEGEEVVEHQPAGSLPPLDEKGEYSTRPPAVASSSFASGKAEGSSGNFSHFDEKLSARNVRRASARGSVSKQLRDPTQEAEGRGAINVKGDAGFEIAEEKLGPGTYFLVVARRKLVGLERFEEQAIY